MDHLVFLDSGFLLPDLEAFLEPGLAEGFGPSSGVAFVGVFAGVG